MKRVLSIALLTINYIIAVGQQEIIDIPQDNYQRPGRPGGVYGKVVEAKGNKAIQAAANQVFVKGNSSTTEDPVDSLVTGTLTKVNGDFGFTSIDLPDSFFVRVSAVGYSEISTWYNRRKNKEKVADPYIDLGNIKLKVAAKILGEVTVVAQRYFKYFHKRAVHQQD